MTQFNDNGIIKLENPYLLEVHTYHTEFVVYLSLFCLGKAVSDVAPDIAFRIVTVLSSTPHVPSRYGESLSRVHAEVVSRYQSTRGKSRPDNAQCL